ncbi:2-keto-4-pentenoate hydratase (plasmid) [Pseudonocardia sp. EC080610-09]|uniref:2-keto-4-pentenoate hydratase n=1 Tax=unclassified Pseudonocardia TaxID=2619320 RepID=UPI0007059A2C|nr:MULTISPECIES: fumarylacetoacetate hydrolase family protein [unclassified Pseudonocardia]ALL79304.1 2-keto-4-pentenoate hydratase [Pseudonocardia sp. EC080610-09]ALL85274.1 2-keto-4-pentenoate hydratase [Pseudonocardia sp. EC080619-01]
MTAAARDSTAVRSAADLLTRAVRTGTAIAPVRTLIGDTDAEVAYAVQRRINDERVGAGAVVVGHKIGLTSPAVQRQLGVDQPDFGILFADMDVSGRASAVPIDRLIQPKIEAEIAFVLAADLAEGPLDERQVADAVGHAVAALEIVDSRVANWDITITDTIADNASSALFVLADHGLALDAFDPAAATMTLRRNGETISQGTGQDCLGSPLAALGWLAGVARDNGDPLRAGQIVLSGALGPMVEARAGDSFSADISPLGSVSVTFGPQEGS